MKKLYSTVNLLLFLIWVSLLAACSVTEEQETSKIEEATAASSPKQDLAGADKASDEGAATGASKDQKDSQQAVKKQPESVVEVIPSQVGEDEGLQIEPIKKQAETTESEGQAQDQEKSETTTAGVDEITAAEVSAEQPPAIEIPVSTGPNHFVITAALKDKSHPNYGKGHKMGFLVNNVQGKELVLERGQTYRFDVVTDPKHDVYISLKGIGWGSTPYSEGVDGMYTYKGTITFKPTEKTPDLLFYSCRNHPFMGGKIHIVNPGETVKIAKTKGSKASAAATTEVDQVTKADVNQKIMFAEMLFKSKNSQTVLKSHISEAIDLHNKAESELKNAKQSLQAGKHSQAYKQADNAVVLLKKSTGLVPNESALEHMKERYAELQASVKDFEASHKESYDRIAKKQGKDAAIDYDKKEVGNLITSAEKYAKQGDYLKANQNLEKAQRAITVAIHKMLNNQTIVYDLNFESAEEEYQYELKRFTGYEELIPIAVEQKKPAEGAKKLMESFVKKGRDLRDRAIKTAKGGDYPTAIAMLQDATKDVRRGLRMIGVMQ